DRREQLIEPRRRVEVGVPPQHLRIVDLAGQADPRRSPARAHPLLHQLLNLAQQREVLLARALLVEHVKLGPLEADAGEAVDAVVALDAQGQVARALAITAVVAVADLLAADAALGLRAAGAVDRLLTIRAVFARV